MDNKTIDQVLYKDIQKEAKKLGIPAKGKKQQLWDSVLEAKKRKRDAKDVPEDQPKAKVARITKPKNMGVTGQMSLGKSNERTETAEKTNRPGLTKSIQYLFSESIISANVTHGVVSKLIDAFEKSSDLAYQQGVYGTCLKASLPLRETLKFENYFSNDILGTEVYKKFVDWVHNDVQLSSMSKQTLRIGAVVQVSGYGKTHLARVYTRYNKGIYIKFSERQSTNYFYKAIHTMINGLQQKYLPVDVEKRTGDNYYEFTEKTNLAIEIFFLAAIEHYAYFYFMISENNNKEFTETELTQISALLFDNGCADLFLQRVQEYWKKIDDEAWFRDRQGKVRELSSAFGLRAIFCDEVHALQPLFIGHFCHTSTPPVWNNKLYAARAAYEQHIVTYPEDKNSNQFPENVREAYKRSTSLTYLIVATLERVSAIMQIGCVLLTTHHAAIDYTGESSLASRDRATIVDFKFERDSVADAARYNGFIQQHFGINLDAYLKTLPDYARIKETLGSRPVYFNWALFATIGIAQSTKPANLNSSLHSIWQKAEEAVLLQAKDYLTLMQSKNKDVFKKVAYAALYHNGYLSDNTLVTTKEIDIGYIPVITEKKIKGITRHRLTDYWMIKHISNIADVSLHLSVLEHTYHSAQSDGPLGEDLMKFLVMTNMNQTFGALAVSGSTFHEESIVHQCQLEVLYAANASEFELSEMEVLRNPETHLKHRLVKVSDTVRPDGLTISKLEDGFVISAWQSKHYKERLDAATVNTALLSLDPQNFFHPNSHERAEWDAIRRDMIWHDKYIRVIWATDFTQSAIDEFNDYNNNKANINRPIVLISHELLPEDFATKFINLPQKQTKGRHVTLAKIN